MRTNCEKSCAIGTTVPAQKKVRDQPRQFQEQPRRGDFRGERTCWEVGSCDQCVGRGRPSSDRVEGGSPSRTIAGTSAPGGRSHQGHEDVHREVEETSGFGARRDHQGARGGVGGTSEIDLRSSHFLFKTPPIFAECVRLSVV